LIGLLAEFDKTLYVSKDFADGANNFTQKAFMGSNYHVIPEMDETVEGYSGVSGIAAALDFSVHDWGGYMFQNGALQAVATVPVSDFGRTEGGLDLSGASSLVFRAKGENGGERVEFFMGGMG
jgi:hypothetical protein